jgi:hypothetical protein
MSAPAVARASLPKDDPTKHPLRLKWQLKPVKLRASHHSVWDQERANGRPENIAEEMAHALEFMTESQLDAMVQLLSPRAFGLVWSAWSEHWR